MECEDEFFKQVDGAYGVCIPKTKLVIFNMITVFDKRIPLYRLLGLYRNFFFFVCLICHLFNTIEDVVFMLNVLFCKICKLGLISS